MAEGGLDGEIKKVRTFKSELLEAKKAYENLVLTKAPTEEIAAAAQKLAEVKDNADDANSAVNALTGAGKFQAVTKSVQAVAGGFTAVKGAISLAGGASEEFQKTIQQVQGAMALTQGLTALEDVGDSFKNLKTVAIDAFKGIKAAIGSTGIGLLLIALGTIAAYWDDITEAVSGVSEEQKKLNKEVDADVAAQNKKLDDINAQDNILKAQGKTEKDILKIKILQTDEVIQATEVQLQNQEATKKAQIEAADRNKKILQGTIMFLTAPLQILLYTVDQVGKALGKDFGLVEGFSGGIAKLVFDPKAVEEEGNKTTDATKKQLTKLKNDRAGFQLQIKDIDKKDTEDKKAKAKTDSDNYQKAEDEKRKITRANALAILTDERDIAKKKQEFAYEDQLREIDELQVSETKKAELRELALTENELALAKIKKDFDDKEQKDREKKAEELKKYLADTEQENLQLQIDAATKAKDEILKNDKLTKEQKEEIEKVYLAEVERLTKESNAKIAASALQDAQKLADDKLLQERVNIAKGIEAGTLSLKDAKAQERLLEQQALEDRLALAKKYNVGIEEAELALYKFKSDKREEDKQANIDNINAALQLAADAAAAGQQLSDAFYAGKLANVQKGSAEETAILEQQFEANKKIQIGQTLISGANGLINLLGAKSLIPEPGASIQRGINVALLIATTAASIAKISATKFEAPKSAGSKFQEGGLLMGNSHDRGGIRNYFGEMEGGEFVVNKQSSAAFLPLLERINSLGNGNSAMANQAAPGPMQQPIIKTYVVASDVSSQQEADKRISDLAAL